MSPTRISDMLSFVNLILILLDIFVWYNNPYMKGNIIEFPPLNNFACHFINLGFIWIYRFLQRFGISSWWLCSHRRYLCFSVSFLCWVSHWVLCGFWIYSSPEYRVACAISYICSLIVNYDRIKCCVITVRKKRSGMTGNQ